MSKKRGLPERVTMRHSSHFVEELASRSEVPVGKLIPIARKTIIKIPDQLSHGILGLEGGHRQLVMLAPGIRRRQCVVTETLDPELGDLAAELSSSDSDCQQQSLIRRRSGFEHFQRYQRDLQGHGGGKRPNNDAIQYHHSQHQQLRVAAEEQLLHTTDPPVLHPLRLHFPIYSRQTG